LNGLLLLLADARTGKAEMLLRRGKLQRLDELKRTRFNNHSAGCECICRHETGFVNISNYFRAE
jgi:hypothetical protein